MCRIRTRSKREASSQNLTRKTSHTLNVPYNFLNGFELISKMTRGASQSAEIRRSAEKSHVCSVCKQRNLQNLQSHILLQSVHKDIVSDVSQLRVGQGDKEDNQARYDSLGSNLLHSVETNGVGRSLAGTKHLKHLQSKKCKKHLKHLQSDKEVQETPQTPAIK